MPKQKNQFNRIIAHERELNRIKRKLEATIFSCLLGGAKLIVFRLKFPLGCFIAADFPNYLNYAADTHFNYLGSKVPLILAFGVDFFNLLWVETIDIRRYRIEKREQ